MSDWLPPVPLIAHFGLIFVIFNLLVLSAAFMVWMERKVCAYIQDRVGPNRVGAAGWLQPFADVIKLLTKEELRPKAADALLFAIAPVISANWSARRKHASASSGCPHSRWILPRWYRAAWTQISTGLAPAAWMTRRHSTAASCNRPHWIRAPAECPISNNWYQVCPVEAARMRRSANACSAFAGWPW